MGGEEGVEEIGCAACGGSGRVSYGSYKGLPSFAEKVVNGSRDY